MTHAPNLHHFLVQTNTTATAAPAAKRFRVMDSVNATEQAQPREIDFCRLTAAVFGLTLYLGVPLKEVAARALRLR